MRSVVLASTLPAGRIDDCRTIDDLSVHAPDWLKSASTTSCSSTVRT
jgi:hypothetical protein